MILLDVDDRRSIDKADDRFHGPTIRLPELSRRAAIGTRSSEVWSLPDYDTSQQQHSPIQPPPRKKSPWLVLNPTFWKASVFVLFIYVAVSIAIAVPLVTKLRAKKEPTRSTTTPNTSLFWTTESDRLGGDNDDVTWIAPWEWKEGTNLTCDNNTFTTELSPSNSTNGTTYSVVSATYELPIGGLVTIRSNYSFSDLTPLAVGGNFTVDISNDDNQKNIYFSVRLNATSRKLRERTRLCFSSGGMNRGLTIYPPNTYGLGERIVLDIRLLLPKNTNIATLITYLPQFRQDFGDLNNRVDLYEMVVEGASAPIVFRSIGAYSLSVKNVLAPIGGTFNITNDLTIDVVEGSINGNITLFNIRNATEPKATRLSIANGDSPLALNVTLDSSGYFGPGNPANVPTFATQIQSYNGAIDLAISHDPDMIPAALKLQIQNALAHTLLRLDSKFEGRFDVQTRLSHVNVLSNFTSPTHTSENEAFQRGVAFERRFPDRAIGWVGQSVPSTVDELKHRVWGTYEVRSSRGPVSLYLT